MTQFSSARVEELLRRAPRKCNYVSSARAEETSCSKTRAVVAVLFSHEPREETGVPQAPAHVFSPKSSCASLASLAPDAPAAFGSCASLASLALDPPAASSGASLASESGTRFTKSESSDSLIALAAAACGDEVADEAFHLSPLQPKGRLARYLY